MPSRKEKWSPLNPSLHAIANLVNLFKILFKRNHTHTFVCMVRGADMFGARGQFWVLFPRNRPPCFRGQGLSLGSPIQIGLGSQQAPGGPPVSTIPVHSAQRSASTYPAFYVDAGHQTQILRFLRQALYLDISLAYDCPWWDLELLWKQTSGMFWGSS